MQRTCVLIKPDGISKKVAGRVLERFESEGFRLVGMKMVPPSESLIRKFYSVHEGKEFFERFIEFMLSGPFIATVMEGENAIDHCRQIMGATNSPEAKEGTLRKLYGTDNRKNLVHGSDSEESARREIGILFKDSELCSS